MDDHPLRRSSLINLYLKHSCTCSVQYVCKRTNHTNDLLYLHCTVQHFQAQKLPNLLE